MILQMYGKNCYDELSPFVTSLLWLAQHDFNQTSKQKEWESINCNEKITETVTMMIIMVLLVDITTTVVMTKWKIYIPMMNDHPYILYSPFWENTFTRFGKGCETMHITAWFWILSPLTIIWIILIFFFLFLFFFFFFFCFFFFLLLSLLLSLSL